MDRPEAITPATLRTQRLELRAMREDDANGFHAIYSDAETMRYWSDIPVRDQDESRARVAEDVRAMREGKGYFWTALVDGAVIGKFVLFQLDQRNRRAEVGYVLNRECWGRGFATEAMAALIDHAFSQLGLHRLEADTDVDNAGSIRLLQRLGFEREGLFRQRWRVYGQWQDSAMFGLLEPDWRRRQG